MSVIEGLWFHAVLPSSPKDIPLVGYRHPSEKDRFHRTNAVHKPVLFFRDWWSLRVDGRLLEGDGPDPAFLGPFAFTVSPWIAPESSCDIAFLSERRVPVTLTVLREDRIFDAVHLDFRDTPLIVRPFTPGVSGHFVFVHETSAGPATVLRLSAVDAPGEPLPSADDLEPFDLVQEDEELHWSLRDGLSEEDLRAVSVASFFPDDKAGPAKLLDTLKFLPYKEEVRLVSELLRKDPETGLAVLRAFPYDLLFRLRPEVLRSVLETMDDRMLAFLWSSASAEQRQSLVAGLPKERRPRPAEGEAVDWDDFREAVQSLATACLQRLSATVITTARRTVTVYTRRPPRSSSGPPPLLSASITPTRPILRPLTCDATSVFLELLHDAEVVQLVVDDLSLSKEQLLEYRGIRRGTILSVPCPGHGLRIKAGLVQGTGLHEQLVEFRKTTAAPADLLGRSSGQPTLKTPASETLAFLGITADDGSLVSCKSFDPEDGAWSPLDGHHLVLWHIPSHRVGLWTSDSRPDLFSGLPHPPRRPPAPPAPFTVSFHPLQPPPTERIASWLLDTWHILRVQDDTSATALGLRLRTVFWLSRLIEEDSWSRLLPVLGRALYAAVLQAAPIPAGERLDILFDIRLPLSGTTDPSTRSDAERVLGLIRPLPLRKPSLLRAWMFNAFARLLDGSAVDGPVIDAIRRAIAKEKDPKTILQALLVLSGADHREVRRILRDRFTAPFTFLIPDDTAAFLSCLELALTLPGRNT